MGRTSLTSGCQNGRWVTKRRQPSVHHPLCMGPGITDPMGIYPQGARYVWNKTEMLAAAADPSVTYLMGNKCPICRDVALRGCLQTLRLCSLRPSARSL